MPYTNPRPISFTARSLAAMPVITFRSDSTTATPQLSNLFARYRDPIALIVRRIYGETYAIEVNRMPASARRICPITVTVVRWSPLENRWLRSALFPSRAFATMNRAAAYVNRAVASYAARERLIDRNRAGWRDADQVAGEPPMATVPRTTREALNAMARAGANELRARPRCPVCATAVNAAGDLCAACQSAGRDAANGEL